MNMAKWEPRRILYIILYISLLKSLYVNAVASHGQTLSHNVVSSTPHHERDSNSPVHRYMNVNYAAT
jgi:hypothetical protein